MISLLPYILFLVNILPFLCNYLGFITIFYKFSAVIICNYNISLYYNGYMPNM